MEEDLPPGFKAAGLPAPPPPVGTSPQEEDDDDTPPGFENTPPGFDNSSAAAASSSAAAAALAQGVSGIQVDGGQDAPDLSLKMHEGLREPESEIKTTTADNTIYAAATTFEALNLPQELLQGLYTEMKFERPSRIQATTLPMVLTPPHRDLIAQAHNGSGKTTCFVLAMLSRVDPSLREPQALCMCPTRELVMQNLQVLEKMAKFTTVKAASTATDGAPGGGGRNGGANGGGGGAFQVPSFARNAKIKEQVVIGTHGKLKNWVAKRLLDVDLIRILVFDEADEMLKADAFADDSVRLIRTIRKKNPEVQLLLFSATFNETVKDFALRIAPKANQVFVPKEELSLDVILQYNVMCPRRMDKSTVLKEMIFPNCEKLGQTIVFVRTRDHARELHREMEEAGYKCTSIQGDMMHSDRDRLVQEFRQGITKILISTDVLSRGLDVSQVTLVINYDVPVERDQVKPNFETYLHRIGRSGRFGRKGAAFNLITGEQEVRQVHAIASYFNRVIPEVAFNDEDAFLGVLHKAGLTDQKAD